MRPARKAAVAVLLCAALLASGCLTRFVRQDVYKDKRIEVYLRTDKRPIRVVEKGHVVSLSEVANKHAGGKMNDVTGRMCPAVRDMALAIARYFKVPVVGIDLISADIGSELGQVIELNASPGLALTPSPRGPFSM